MLQFLLTMAIFCYGFFGSGGSGKENYEGGKQDKAWPWMKAICSWGTWIFLVYLFWSSVFFASLNFSSWVFLSVLFVAKLSIVNFTHGFKSAGLTRGWWAITGVQMEGAIWRHHLQLVSLYWHVPRLVSRGIFICRMVTQHLQIFLVDPLWILAWTFLNICVKGWLA